MYVYVLNKNNIPIMPCSPRKARKLLKENKAKVVKRTPFTIKLLFGSSGYRQNIVLGVDAGSRHIGFSASTKEKELYSAELTPRNDVVGLLSARKAMRRTRRNNKTRYRKARFNNRVRSKHKGWLAPSVEIKIQEHITIIKRICNLLPVIKIIVETAEFDLQKLKAKEEGRPIPKGKDYQNGEQYDEYNVRQYILKRDNYTCQYCKAKMTPKIEVKFHVHHIESRTVGGNAPNNLITLCKDCHKALHNNEITLSGAIKRNKSFKDAAFMGIMRKTLMRRLKNELDVPISETYGYITKCDRENYNIEKSHTNDALCVTGNITAKPCDITFNIKAIRHHNRKLHKNTILKGGIRKNNQAPKMVKGFKLWDKVLFENQECFISGRRTTGYFMLKKIDGTKVHNSASYKDLKLLEHAANYIIEKNARNAIPLKNLKVLDLLA